MDKISLFIAGTDTGVGKTVVTGLMARLMSENGYKVITQKWVQSGGGSGIAKDVKSHLNIMKMSEDKIKDYRNDVAPYVFSFPASPHLSSRLENKKIDMNRIISAYNNLESHFDAVIVEGIGGLMVPYNNKDLVIDICSKIKLPVLLVSANRLGCINHSILSVEALRKRNMEILGIIFNHLGNDTDKIILKDNPDIVAKITGVNVFGDLSYDENTENLYRYFRPLGEKIIDAIRAYTNYF